MEKKLLILLGPTAVGKTDYSIAQALRYGSPIISCDSRQIYKEMTIGTAVPSAEQLSAVRLPLEGNLLDRLMRTYTYRIKYFEI